jgi:hypothetical protein
MTFLCAQKQLKFVFLSLFFFLFGKINIQNAAGGIRATGADGADPDGRL